MYYISTQTNRICVSGKHTHTVRVLHPTRERVERAMVLYNAHSSQTPSTAQHVIPFLVVRLVRKRVVHADQGSITARHACARECANHMHRVLVRIHACIEGEIEALCARRTRRIIQRAHKSQTPCRTSHTSTVSRSCICMYVLRTQAH